MKRSRLVLLVLAAVAIGLGAGVAVGGLDTRSEQTFVFDPIGDPLDTASPSPTGQPSLSPPDDPIPDVVVAWTPPPPVTPTWAPVTEDPCAGLPVPDVRYRDYRERWVAAGRPVTCLPRLPFDGAVGPDADARRLEYARQHPNDPVYGGLAPKEEE